MNTKSSRGSFHAGVLLAFFFAIALSSSLAANLLYLSRLPRVRGYYLFTNPWLLSAQGISGAIAILAAAWIVWGAGRLTTRLALSAFWMTVVLLLWQRLLPSSRVPWVKIEQELLAIATWLGAIGLCAAAWRFGIRVVDRSQQALGGDPRSRQMSLLGLLALMSGAAVILGVARIVVPRQTMEVEFTADDVFRLVAQTGGSLLAASTVITCFHQPRAVWINLLLTWAFVAAIALLHLVAWGQSYRMNLLPPDSRIILRGIHYGTLTGCLLASVGLLHACGLRLRRQAPQPAASTTHRAAVV